MVTMSHINLDVLHFQGTLHNLRTSISFLPLIHSPINPVLTRFLFQ